MTVYHPTDDLFLNISRGLVRGTSSVHKFGAVNSMSTSTAGTVWARLQGCKKVLLQ